MGSAEQEITSKNIQSLVREEESTTDVHVSTQLEDKKNIENEGIAACASVVSEFPLDSITSSQTVDLNLSANRENITDKINELAKTTSSTKEKSDESNSDTLLDATDGMCTTKSELQQTAKIQNFIDKFTEHDENNAVGNFSDNKSLPNCDASVSKLSSGFELPVTMELERNDVGNIAGLTSEIPEESDSLGESNTQTSTAQTYDKVMSGQQRSTMPRVCASGGHSQTTGESVSTYWAAQVPPSTNEPYGFRYCSLTLITIS